MDICSGADLIKVFSELGINTGNIPKALLDAWCDTDCQATKELFSWLCTYLDRNNVLTSHEEQEYERLLEGNLLLTSKQYDAAVSQIQTDFPEILDYEVNEFEVECLEDELEMLRKEERELEQLLQLCEDLNENLVKDINKAVDEEIKLVIDKEHTQKECLELSQNLDGLHKKLHMQIGDYSKHLNEFECASDPFLSNIPTASYNQYYSDVTSYVSLFLKKQQELIPKMDISIQTTVKKHTNSLQSTEGIAEQFEAEQQRILEISQQCLYKEIQENKLSAEIEFLENLDINKVLDIPIVDNNCILEASVVSVRELLRQIFEEIKSIAQQISEEVMDDLKINLSENAIAINKEKLKTLNEVDLNVKKIFAKHFTFHLLLDKEKHAIQSTDQFFRDVHSYIVNHLYNCQMQTNAMGETIDAYKHYNLLPIEEKFPIINVMNILLSNIDEASFGNGSFLEKLEVLNKKHKAIEEQVFITDCKDHRDSLQKVQQQFEAQRNFLSNGPTNHIIIVPYESLQILNEAEKFLKAQKATLDSAMKAVNTTQKKLTTNKWLQMRRYLWMWFLINPKRLTIACEEIKAAIKELR